MFPGSGISPKRDALNAWKRFVVLPLHFAGRTTPSPCQPTPERERQLRRQHRGLVTPQTERKYGGLAAWG